MRRLDLNVNEGNLGFQIAPMIDVVFVIMLFFMVMAGAVKVENELNTQLPGMAETAESMDFVDEQIITIEDNGQVSLNDEPFDSPESRELRDLRGTLMRLKQNADAAKTPAVVTIISDEQAKYSRTVDVPTFDRGTCARTNGGFSWLVKGGGLRRGERVCGLGCSHS
jgi:biopolymer transport protein ExbD